MDLLNRVLEQILGNRPELKRGINEARILDLWPKAVGAQIAKYAQAVSLKGSTIMISIEHPIWKQELHSNKQLALKKLNECIYESLGHPPKGDRWIDDLFIVNPTKALPKFQKKSPSK